MGNLIMNFLHEQGILLVMGLMVLEGIVHQWVSARRYRKLRGGLQSLLTGFGQDNGQRQPVHIPAGKENDMTAGDVAEISGGSRKRGRRTSHRQEVGRSAPELVANKELVVNKELLANKELDEQLLYLKQSLERIAAGRDQKLEEVPPVRHKLTPEQEAVIADILREYLS